MKTIIAVCLLIFVGTTTAYACADGPDYYRVVKVASDDVLNVRSGPGTGFSVIGTLPHNAEKIESRDQVPVHLCNDLSGLTEFERKNLWTKILWESKGRSVYGWVKSSFLAE